MQETRGWSDRDEVTFGQRGKEYAQDYRYFPEPDLPPLLIGADRLMAIQNRLPELPRARAARFVEEYGLPKNTARVLSLERRTAEFFEETAKSSDSAPATEVAKWLAGDVQRLLNDAGVTLAASLLTPVGLGELMGMLHAGAISGAAGKAALEEMFNTGDSAEVIVERRDLRQLDNDDAVSAYVDRIVADNPDIVALYRRGKVNVLQALVGKVMQATGGRANPPRVKQLLETKLGIPR
jgi:aspartyl-tRNA(Asn)/glutamyl-tRNA(Gln) amidotransferase subunit B